MTYPRVRSLVAFASYFFLATMSALAQSTSATIVGRVVDSTGATIAGAEVRVINQVDQNTRTFTTTSSGECSFPNLEPGAYTLTARAAGFKTYEKKGLQLSASDRLAAGDVQLEVGAISETVEVASETAQIQTASAERSGLLD